MSKRKTDFRAQQARRDAALARPELRDARKPEAPSEAEIARAVAEGKFTKVPERRRAKWPC